MVGDFAEEASREVGRIARRAVDDKVRRSRRTPALVQLASDRLDPAAAVRDEQYAAVNNGSPSRQFLNTLDRGGMADQLQSARSMTDHVSRPRIAQHQGVWHTNV
jgi:hypothetical protein